MLDPASYVHPLDRAYDQAQFRLIFKSIYSSMVSSLSAVPPDLGPIAAAGRNGVRFASALLHP